MGARLKRATVTRELFVLTLGDDQFLIYAPLQQSAVIVNNSMVRALQTFLQNPNQDDAPADPTVGLFRSLGIVDPGTEGFPIRALTARPEPVEAMLLLTTACNLRCSYCYASTGEG